MAMDADGLFADGDQHSPKRSAHFSPKQIVLTKGSRSSPQRRRFVEGICRLYPEAKVWEQEDRPHNRVDLGCTDPLDAHRRGKETLVLGEHKSAVGLSQEHDNCCPNYWHFSPYGFCPYGCTYCYLAGTRGVYFSPTVKIFVNLPEMLGRMNRVAREAGRPTAFYLGKLQDGLALDPLTGYSRVMVPFFANHPLARLVALTKAADVENLLDLPHGGHTILSWSLNPPEVVAEFEPNVPPVERRLDAMRRCAAAGYPVRAVMMPIIPIDDWQSVYERFLRELLRNVRLDRLTLGGICSYPNAVRLTEAKVGASTAITPGSERSMTKSADGRARYDADVRIRMFRHLLDVIREMQPGLAVGLCLEERRVFEALGMTHAIGCCNCVL